MFAIDTFCAPCECAIEDVVLFKHVLGSRSACEYDVRAAFHSIVLACARLICYSIRTLRTGTGISACQRLWRRQTRLCGITSKRPTSRDTTSTLVLRSVSLQTCVRLASTLSNRLLPAGDPAEISQMHMLIHQCITLTCRTPTYATQARMCSCVTCSVCPCTCPQAYYTSGVLTLQQEIDNFILLQSGFPVPSVQYRYCPLPPCTQFQASIRVGDLNISSCLGQRCCWICMPFPLDLCHS